MQKMYVPCGKCPNCVARRVSGWSFRLMQEEKKSLSAHFVTLTYMNEKLPRTPKNYKTLNKKDVQDFMKRLRYYSPKLPKIKYYAAGEYGSETMRPHYHIIIFNATEESILNAWQLGHVHFGTVSAASVGYSLKYISKKGKIPMHANDDRIPEFSLSSTKLGACYLTDQVRKYHEEDIYNRMYLETLDGKKIAMPRYYKDKLYTKEQRQHIGAYQAGRMQDELQKQIEQYNGDWYRDKAEADKAAKQRLEWKTKKGDKL